MRLDNDDEDHSDQEAEEPLKCVSVVSDDPEPAFVRPALVASAKLRDCQLERVASISNPVACAWNLSCRCTNILTHL